MIYLDNASTTKVLPEVVDAVKITMEKYWGNPSNMYDIGLDSKKILNEARIGIATAIGAKPEEIFFTSGSSEGNAWIVEQAKAKGGKMLCSPYEHHNFISNPNCVLIDENYLCLAISQKSMDESNNIPTEWYSLKHNICSWMYVNNETGEIFDIARICKMAHSLDMLFHSDMTQALGNILINVKDLNVDYATFTGHKVGAPKGIGFVYINSDSINSVKPLIYGGSQQNGIRAGTENLPYIEGLRIAVVNACNHVGLKKAHCYKLKNLFLTELEKNFIKDKDYIVVSPENSINSTVCVCFKDITGEALMLALNNKHIYIGTGSACNTGDLEPSTVLSAMNISDEFINGEIRLSFSMNNTEQEIIDTVKAIKEVVSFYNNN